MKSTKAQIFWGENIQPVSCPEVTQVHKAQTPNPHESTCIRFPKSYDFRCLKSHGLTSNRPATWGLTYAKSEVEQPHADVKTEEKDNIGYFAEHENIPHMLVHSD